MKIKLLNSGGYTHNAGIEFPIVIDDDNAEMQSHTMVLVSRDKLIKAGFTDIDADNKNLAFCLAGHPYGREAVIL